MGMSMEELEAGLKAVQDRLAIQDVLYRYASTIDRRDMVGLRATMADEFRGKYGDAPWIEGAEAAVAWIDSKGQENDWQHHLLSVYHVDVDGDHAKALTYHTSHQTFPDQPKQPRVIIARYHDELVRTPDGWKISSKIMEIGYRGIRNVADAL